MKEEITKIEFPKMVYHKDLGHKVVKDEKEFEEAKKEGFSKEYIAPEKPVEIDVKEELVLAKDSIKILEKENEKLIKEIEALKKKAPKKGK